MAAEKQEHKVSLMTSHKENVTENETWFFEGIYEGGRCLGRKVSSCGYLCERWQQPGSINHLGQSNKEPGGNCTSKTWQLLRK